MNTLLFWFGYLTIFVLALCAVLWWDRRRRRTKPPFPENLKLLRMPGEYLWQRVPDNDESDPQWLLLVMLVPLVAGAAVLQVVSKLQLSLATRSVVTVIALAFSLLLCVRWYQGRLQRRADDYLGFFGERYVAECLDPLKAQGWFIFHDIPCVGGAGPFNLDHVALGPGGVWVVETKTRRKGRTRPGRKEHEVVFDGAQIIWPWWEETESLKQAADNAHWLRELIEKLTGKAFDVAAVLTFPGYYVIERRLGPVRVVNPKLLPQVLVARGNSVLSDADIDLIRRQLEEKCRNVEY